MIQTSETKTSKGVIDFKLKVNNDNTFFFVKRVENSSRVFNIGHIHMATHTRQVCDKKAFGKKAERVSYLICLF